MEDVSNKTNHDVSGLGEAETNTKPSGKYDTSITAVDVDMIYFSLDLPASAKEGIENSARNESGNPSQDQSKFNGDRNVSLI